MKEQRCFRIVTFSSSTTAEGLFRPDIGVDAQGVAQAGHWEPPVWEKSRPSFDLYDSGLSSSNTISSAWPGMLLCPLSVATQPKG